MDTARVIVVGMLCDDKYSKMMDISRRVYGIDGIAPTIHTSGGGNQEPKIMIYGQDNNSRHTE